MYSYHRELYSYVLFLKARKMGLPLHYSAQKIEADSGYAYYTDKSDKQSFIKFKDRKYCIEKKGNKLIESNRQEEILDYIKTDIS